MAGPTFSDYGTGETGTSPLSVSWHSGSAPVNGTFLLADVHASVSGTSIVPPSGWNTYFNAANSSSNYQLEGLFWKSASSESVSESWGTSTTGKEIHVVITSWTGVYSGAAPQITGPSSTTSGTSSTTGTITPNFTGSLVIATFHGSSSLTAAWSTSTGCTLAASEFVGNKSIMVEYQNALSTLSTTSGITSNITGSIGTGALNSFQIVVSPNPIIIPNLTDNASALLDTPSYTSVTATPSISENLNSGTLSDSITPTVSLAITFSNDALSGISDSFTAGQGSNLTFTDKIYPLIDALSILNPNATGSQYLGLADALSLISDVLNTNIVVSVNVSDTGPTVSDTATRADTIPIPIVEGISSQSDSATILYSANLIFNDSLPPLVDTLLFSASLIATLTLKDNLSPSSDGFITSLGFVQLGSLGQSIYTFSQQAPSTAPAPNVNTTRLQFFPFAPMIAPTSNTPSVTNPTQVTFPMDPEIGV